MKRGLFWLWLIHNLKDILSQITEAYFLEIAVTSSGISFILEMIWRDTFHMELLKFQSYDNLQDNLEQFYEEHKISGRSYGSIPQRLNGGQGTPWPAGQSRWTLRGIQKQ